MYVRYHVPASNSLPTPQYWRATNPPYTTVLESLPTNPPYTTVLESLPTNPPYTTVLERVPTNPPYITVLEIVPTNPPYTTVLGHWYGPLSQVWPKVTGCGNSMVT